VAYAFAGGYRLALEALSGDARDAALCVTEVGGNHPRAIETTFADGRVTGVKQWATGADRAATLLVCAKTGDGADGRPLLVLVRVAAAAPGVTIEAASAAFVPEIAHAKVTLAGAAGERLPGDGYADYVKPFRTVEDLHVHAALIGYWCRVARERALAIELRERLLALAACARGLAGEDPKAASTHAVLGGLIATTAAVVPDLERAWELAAGGADDWTRWVRDRAILAVASKARVERRARAWELLAP
jgi:alkylation response protein AidB-like acyl-CoA dehydrogenase